MSDVNRAPAKRHVITGITEHTARTSQAAHDVQDELIRQGIDVSLIAFDPSRELYVFDSYSD